MARRRQLSDLQRLLVHIPWGLYIAFLFWVFWPLGFSILIASLVRQAMQDWRKGDASWKDVLGTVTGLAIGGGILGVIKIVGVMI